MKKSFEILSKIAFILLLGSISFSSCKKDDNDDNGGTSSGPTLKTTVIGKVTDLDGKIVIGATVKIGQLTTTTDNRGTFLFINASVPKDRFVANVSKQGYFNSIKGVRTQAGEVNYLNVVLEELPTAVNVSGTAGGTVSIPGTAGSGKIIFSANSFVTQNGTPYTGNVKVYSRHLNPADDNFASVIPGGDLLATNAAGSNVSLYTLGMIEAKIYDNTGINELELASGVTAELQFPIDPSQSSMAQATIPLWYLDETTGIWKEDGMATKVGSQYRGNVSHFSTWNCDYPGERCDIQGKVVDCVGNPMANITVTINGFLNVVTNNAGMYTTWVPIGYVITCQVLQLHNPILTADSQLETFTAVGGMNTVPDLIVQCATRIAGTVKTCAGVLSSAWIYMSWNGGTYFHYTSSGNYNTNAPVNTTVNILASQSVNSGSVTATTGSQGGTVNAPPITMCSVSSVLPNLFRYNSGTGSTLFNVSTTSSNTIFADQNGDGIIDIYLYMGGKANPGNYDCTVSISLTESSGDYYSLAQNSGNMVLIELDSIYQYGSGLPLNTTANKLYVTDYGSPGGYIQGTYEYDTGTGTITEGSFSIPRNN